MQAIINASTLLFALHRRQFPIVLASAVRTNVSQGHSLASLEYTLIAVIQSRTILFCQVSLENNYKNSKFGKYEECLEIN